MPHHGNMHQIAPTLMRQARDRVQDRRARTLVAPEVDPDHAITLYHMAQRSVQGRIALPAANFPANMPLEQDGRCHEDRHGS